MTLLLHSSLINEVVLAVTAVVLLCGSAGLVLVSLSSPLLRGLLWVSGSCALGGGSAFVRCLQQRNPQPFSWGMADLLMLGCFVCLDLGVRAVHHEATRLSRISAVLLALQTLLLLIPISSAEHERFCAIGGAALLAVQACASAWMLLRQRSKVARAPEQLCGWLLVGYAVLLGLRNGVLEIQPLHTTSHLADERAGVSVATLALLLGIAFAFFWMTTSAFATGLERIASTDPLTRIFNRRTFLLWCDKEVERSFVSGAPFSLLLLDLDHFKQVNDLYGHQVGDRMLCSVVERVQDGVRGIDVLGRWGGEEFCVLLPRASAEAAFLVAERVRRNIERSSIALTETEGSADVRQLGITASLGAATFRGPGDSITALFERADTALYTAKRSGRNRTAASPSAETPQAPEPGAAGGLPAGLLGENAGNSPELVV